jgi:hypothetical protein
MDANRHEQDISPLAQLVRAFDCYLPEMGDGDREVDSSILSGRDFSFWTTLA